MKKSNSNFIYTILFIIAAVLFLWVLTWWWVKSSITMPFTRDGEYYVREIPNFLSPEECDHIMQFAQPKLFKSKVYTSNNDLEDNKVRISEQCWVKDEEDPIIANISRRIATATGMSLKSQEELQIVRYKAGGFYKPHYDACNKLTDDCTRLNKGLGPRCLTFIIYLNDDFEGGETHFPLIKTSVIPERGKAAIFYNVDSEGEVLPKSLHGSSI